MKTRSGGTHEEERETMSDLIHAYRQPAGGAIGGLRQAVADDLLALSRLHGGKLDWHTITTLQRRAYDDVLELPVRGEPALTALAMLRAGLPVIPTSLVEYTLNRLNADYAKIYPAYLDELRALGQLTGPATRHCGRPRHAPGRGGGGRAGSAVSAFSPTARRP
ncbi:hypothetical protein [uncultured Thiodictyon sp.]|uniref:hypothetical protein n=1 Tax=uncultured Thiodictyon sp. TaxID=1846217 RepID=UPI0025EBBD5E|nr:hypothetical protein [uncultured Thiodictyon sp.]